MKRILMLGALVALGACIKYTSPAPELSPLLQSARGSMGVAALEDGSHADGELIELADSSLTVLQANRLVVVPLRDIARVEFGEFRSYRLSAGAPKWTIEQGKASSRFPLGMTPAARDAILRGLNLTKTDTLRVRR